MAEIIEIPVQNNSSVSEYTPEQVGGIIAGVIFGLLFLVLLVRGNTKLERIGGFKRRNGLKREKTIQSEILKIGNNIRED